MENETVLIRNKVYQTIDLIKVFMFLGSEVKEYKKDKNCRPNDWIEGSNLTELQKASFVYGIINNLP